MRYMLVVGVCLAVAGCAAHQQAASPQPVAPGAVGTLTMQEAVGQMGAPTYQRACEDGSTTLGWKHQASPPQTTAPTGQGRFLVMYGPSEADPKEVLVCKFDPSGKLLWWREVK
jgi:hypothetical protein